MKDLKAPTEELPANKSTSRRRPKSLLKVITWTAALLCFVAAPLQLSLLSRAGNWMDQSATQERENAFQITVRLLAAAAPKDSEQALHAQVISARRKAMQNASLVPELRLRVEPILTNQAAAAGPPFDENAMIRHWRNELERREVTLVDDGVLPPPRPHVAVWDYACCGLGHRLGYASSKFHLTKALNVTRLNNNWGSCPNKFSETGELPWIFEHLFGFGPLIVTPPETPIYEEKPIVHPTALAPNVSSIQPPLDLSYLTVRKHLIIDNECPMYRQYNIVKFIREQLEGKNSFQRRYMESRAQSDYEYYTQLWNRYRLRDRAEAFMRKHRFDQHTVFGIHIRAGNGEKGDFARKGRGIADVDAWVRNTVSLIRALYQKLPDMTGVPASELKPPLLFVATDTGSIVNALRNATVRQNDAEFHMRVVSFPQHYVAEGAGVSYRKGTNDGCLGGWDAQVTDMGILSVGSDVVVAGQSSSFSQTMPLSFSIGRNVAPDDMANKKLFCEVGQDGDLMECFNKISDWALMEGSFPLIALDGADKSRIHARKSFAYYNVPYEKFGRKFRDTVDFLTYKTHNDKPRLRLKWNQDILQGGRCTDIACKTTKE